MKFSAANWGSVMGNVAELDDLTRAAAAAGFAMAGAEDDFDDMMPSTAFAKVSSGEAVARGVRLPKSEVSARAETVAAPDTAKGRLLSSAQSVRESVYGYLRFSIPA